MPEYCISGVTINIDAPKWTLHDNLGFFLSDTGDSDIFCRLVFERRPVVLIEEAKILIKIPGTLIYEHQGCIHNLYSHEDIPSYTIASRDWTSCTIFVDPAYNNPSDNQIIQSVREGVFSELRKFVIAALAPKKSLLIHSSTILWHGRGIVFSAPSGVGKTTHTNNWKRIYETPILNGDTAACSMINGVPIVYGIPWCGTSGQFLNKNAPLGSLVFLQQAKENSIKKIDMNEAFIRLTARCFLLPLNEMMMNNFLGTAEEIVQSVDCYLLNCLPDRDAVELVKKCLQKN